MGLLSSGPTLGGLASAGVGAESLLALLGFLTVCLGLSHFLKAYGLRQNFSLFFFDIRNGVAL